jgi:hypothetical protein
MGQSLTLTEVTLDPREGTCGLPISGLSYTPDSTSMSAGWASTTSDGLVADPVIDFTAPPSKIALEQLQREDVRRLVSTGRSRITPPRSSPRRSNPKPSK